MFYIRRNFAIRCILADAVLCSDQGEQMTKMIRALSPGPNREPARSPKARSNGVTDVKGSESWPVLVIVGGYCLFTALFIAIYRAPLDSPPLIVLIYYVFIGISAIAAYSAGDRLAAGSGWQSYGLPVLFFLVVCAIPFLTAYVRLNAALSIIVMAIVCCVAVIGGLTRPLPWRQVLLSAAVSLILAGYCFVTVNAMKYATVLSPENALAGLLDRDTLYHAAIAAMFHQFGVPSTGLDGIPLTHYHTLTHIWLGTVAGGVGLNAVFGYFLGNQIVFIPLVYFSISVTTRAMAGASRNATSSLVNTLIPIAILLLIGLVDWNSYLVSESHAVGLTFVLLGVAFLVQLANRLEQPIPMPTLAIGFLISLLASGSKVSAGGLFSVAFYYLLLRSGKLTILQHAVLALFWIALLWLLRSFFLPSAHAEQSTLSPLHFLFTYSSTAVVNLAAILVAAVICALRWKKKQNRPLQEALLVMLAAGTAPALLLKVDGGSAYYFINVATWIAVAIVAAALIRQADALQPRFACLLAIGATVLFISADLIWHHTVSRFRSIVNELQETASATNASSLDGNSIVEKLNEGPLGRLATTITKNRGEIGAPIVMIEPQLWEKLPYSCPYTPFFVPAYIGLPLLLGLQQQAAKCEIGPYYSMPDYGPQSLPQSGLDDSSACALAKARGFEKLLRVETLDDARLLDCS